MRRIVIVFLAFYIGGCTPVGTFFKRVTSYVDKKSFQWFGGTMVGAPGQITLKEVHLDDGSLLGKDIILEGSVVSIGEHATYLIISDDSARLLVVLTNMYHAKDFLDKFTPKTLRVYGTVERGKKGMPFIAAKALVQTTEESAKT
jgi:hypothetical protein